MKTILKVLICVAIVGLIVSVLLKVKIKNIDIIGNSKVSDLEIVTSLFENEIDRTSIVFFIKTKLKKKKVIPLVNSYDIKWVTPFSLAVTVHENDAIAFIKRDLKNVYFDQDGVVIEITEERKHDVIEVIGVSFKNYEKGDRIGISNKKILKAILNITNFLKEKGLKAELLEIKREEEIYIYMGNIIANMGNTDNMEIKLLRLNDIYPEISHLNGTLDLSNARENMIDEQYVFKKAS